MINTFNGQLTNKSDSHCYICGTGIQKMYSPFGLCFNCDKGDMKDVNTNKTKPSGPIQKVIPKQVIKHKQKNKRKKKKSIEEEIKVKF